VKLETIKNAVTIVALGVGIAVGVIVAYQTLSDEDDDVLELPAADEPPLEYVYLDSARVLAYLGQIERGLATTETRTLSEKRAGSVGVSGDNFVEVSKSVERQRESQQVVTQTEADRFFTFLRILRAEDTTRPLSEIDARLTKTNTFEVVRAKLGRLREGDFVRIRGAQLSLPAFAAVYPRVRHVPFYKRGELRPPLQPLYAPISNRERKDVIRYRRRLETNPRLPFIVPTINTIGPQGEEADQGERKSAKPEGQLNKKSGAAAARTSQVATFIVPVRYAGLTTESGLLAGNVSMVGKVVYKDPRLPSEVSEEDRVPPYYLDRQALATFGQALKRAPVTLLEDLGIPRASVGRRLKTALRIPSPVVLVVPLAIYQ
jgi:hypothetical protein